MTHEVHNKRVCRQPRYLLVTHNSLQGCPIVYTFIVYTLHILLILCVGPFSGAAGTNPPPNHDFLIVELSVSF